MATGADGAAGAAPSRTRTVSSVGVRFATNQASGSSAAAAALKRHRVEDPPAAGPSAPPPPRRILEAARSQFEQTPLASWSTAALVGTGGAQSTLEPGGAPLRPVIRPVLSARGPGPSEHPGWGPAPPGLGPASSGAGFEGLARAPAEARHHYAGAGDDAAHLTEAMGTALSHQLEPAIRGGLAPISTVLESIRRQSENDRSVAEGTLGFLRG